MLMPILTLAEDIAQNTEGFLVGFFIAIPLAIWSVVMLWEVIADKIDWTSGILGIVLGLSLGVINLVANKPWVSMSCFITAFLLSPLYFLTRYVVEQLSMKRFDNERLLNAHDTLKLRPDNMMAKFKIAEILWDSGYRGHAYGYAANLLPNMPHTHYANEHHTVKKWYGQIGNEDLAPMKCKACGHMNPPGDIYCERCKTEYLLLAFRKNVKTSDYNRKAFTFMAVFVLLCIALPLSLMMQIAIGIKLLAAGFVTVLALTLLIREFLTMEGNT